MEKGKYQFLLCCDWVLENPDLYSPDSLDEPSELLKVLDTPSPSELTEISSGEEQVDERIEVKPLTRVSKGKDMNKILLQQPTQEKDSLKYPNMYSSLKDSIYFSEHHSMARMKQKARNQPEHPPRAKYPHLDNRRERA